MSQEPDQLGVATLVNGLPTCTFAPRGYARKVTNVVVTNGVSSIVNCYRGSLSSTPVATNKLGDRNTIAGQITIPAGQQFFVQWSVAGTPVSSATARVSWQTADPFDGSSDFQSWAEQLVSLLQVIGPNGSEIDIDTTGVVPTIRFFSVDHTNQANVFISTTTAFPSRADLILNSGQYTPVDGIPRLPMLWFAGDVLDSILLHVSRGPNNRTLGGVIQLKSNRAEFAYRDYDGGIFWGTAIDDAGLVATTATNVKLNTISQPFGEIGASYSTAGVLITTVGVAEIAMSVYGIGGLNTIFVFNPGRLYAIEVAYNLVYSATATSSTVRLRKGLNNLAGQQLGYDDDDYNGANPGIGIPKYATFYVKNATAAAITTSLGFTVQRIFGAGNVSLYGDAPRPLIARVHDIGDTTLALAGVATAIV